MTRPSSLSVAAWLTVAGIALGLAFSPTRTARSYPNEGVSAGRLATCAEEVAR